MEPVSPLRLGRFLYLAVDPHMALAVLGHQRAGFCREPRTGKKKTRQDDSP